jgi:hypothetical protein
MPNTSSKAMPYSLLRSPFPSYVYRNLFFFFFFFPSQLLPSYFLLLPPNPRMRLSMSAAAASLKKSFHKSWGKRMNQ